MDRGSGESGQGRGWVWSETISCVGHYGVGLVPEDSKGRYGPRVELDLPCLRERGLPKSCRLSSARALWVLGPAGTT